MNVSTVTPKAQTPTTSAAAATDPSMTAPDSFNNPSSVLNQTDFLKLLVAQIQYQDPMNPQSDTQMAAQMAQFTTLQQATQSTSSLAMMQANSLVGSTVTVQVDSLHSASGMVTGVVLKNGAPQITIGGNNYALNQITAVAPTTMDPTSGTANTGTSGTTSTGTDTSNTGTSGTSSTTNNNN